MNVNEARSAAVSGWTGRMRMMPDRGYGDSPRLPTPGQSPAAAQTAGYQVVEALYERSP